MTYNNQNKVYEKTVWVKIGSQFKFIANKENKVSSHYPVVYVQLILIGRIRKDFKTISFVVKQFYHKIELRYPEGFH